MLVEGETELLETVEIDAVMSADKLWNFLSQ